MWSHSVVEHLLCEVMCLGVRDGAAETLLTGVKVVPETMYLGKSSIGGDIAHIGDWFVFSCVYYIIRFIGNSSSTTRRSRWITAIQEFKIAPGCLLRQCASQSVCTVVGRQPGGLRFSGSLVSSSRRR